MLSIRPIHHCLLAIFLWCIVENSTLGFELTVQTKFLGTLPGVGTVDLTSNGPPHDSMQLLVNSSSGEVFLKGPPTPAAIDYGFIFLSGPSELFSFENAIRNSTAAELLVSSREFTTVGSFEFAIWELHKPNPATLFNQPTALGPVLRPGINIEELYFG